MKSSKRNSFDFMLHTGFTYRIVDKLVNKMNKQLDWMPSKNELHLCATRRLSRSYCAA